METARVSGAVIVTATGSLSTDPPAGTVTEAEPLNWMGWLVPGTSAAPPALRATVAEATTRGASPKRLEMRTRKAEPSMGTVTRLRTVELLTSWPGSAQAMADAQATCHTGAAAAADGGGAVVAGAVVGAPARLALPPGARWPPSRT